MVVPPDLDRLGSDLPNWSPRQVERIQDLARARQQRPGRFAPWERDIGFLIGFYEHALSLVGSGGRLVVETPCEHGDWAKWPHYTDEGECPGGSRRVVWPTDKETA